MQKQNKISSLLGLALIFGIVVFGNLMVSKMSVRLDITEEKLFTLSQGSHNILKNLNESVTLKFFYSKSIEGVPPQLKNYSKRVLSLLQEYVENSDQINLEIIDPEPDSEQEEIAQRYGIKGQAISQGVNFYFGLVVSNFSGEETLAYFDLRRERFLEYDITRSIYLLNLSGKPKIGVLSSLEVLGVKAPPNQFGMPPQPNAPKGIPAWMFTHELQKFYTLEKIESSSDAIPSYLDLLVVMHAKDLSDKMQYAIDQFVMLGKNVVFVVDPMYMKDQQGKSQFQPPTPNTSLDKLFKKWGIDYSSEKVALDPVLAAEVPTRNGVTKHPAVLKITNATVSKEDVVTAQLSALVMLYPGAVALNKGVEGIEFQPLISTSDRAKLQEKMSIMYSQPADMMSSLKSGGSIQSVAGLFSGRFSSAFDKAPEGLTNPYIAKSSNEGSLLVITDMDMFEDQYCMQPIEIMGQVLGYQPLNQNTVFLSNVLEKMTGNRDLIGLRSRGKFSRPFDKVTEMENLARVKWQEKEEELQAKVKALEEKISLRLQQSGQNQQIILSTEDEEAIQKFREEKIKEAKALRQVRKNLRGDIENLGTYLKIFNILFAPLLVILFGSFIAFSKSRRIRA